MTYESNTYEAPDFSFLPAACLQDGVVWIRHLCQDRANGFIRLLLYNDGVDCGVDELMAFPEPIVEGDVVLGWLLELIPRSAGENPNLPVVATKSIFVL